MLIRTWGHLEKQEMSDSWMSRRRVCVCVSSSFHTWLQQLSVCYISRGKIITCLKPFKTIKLPVTESSAARSQSRRQTTWIFSPLCLTSSSASNLSLLFSLFSPTFTCQQLLPASPSLSQLLSPLSHYHSLASWPRRVLTVLVSIRRLPRGCWACLCLI